MLYQPAHAGRSASSFPNSPCFHTPVWERESAKLRFASGPQATRNRSFAECVPKQEFGNEANREPNPRLGHRLQGTYQ
jgi:hypothetical protein